MTVIKWHFMTFMTVIKCQMIVSKYANIGIKLTALIWILQIITRFSISNYRGIKKTKLVNLKIFPFVHPFIKWGSFEGHFRLAVQQKVYIFENGMRYLRSWCDQKWKQAMAEQGPTRVPISTMCNSNITSIYLISF